MLHRPGSASVGFAEYSIAVLLGLMLLFAPLFRAAKPPLALLVLELAAIAILALVFVQRDRLPRLGLAPRLALALLCAVPIVQLLPLPAGLWARLPGAAARVADLESAGAWPTNWLPISMTPSATESALWSLLVPLAALFGIRSLDRTRSTLIASVLLLVAALEALLALAQFPQSEFSPLRLDMPWLESAGTYTNRNHLAGLLEMSLPIGVGLLAVSLRHHHEVRGLRWTSLRAAPLMYSALCVALVLGLVFSRSRAGLALGALGLAVSVSVFGRRIAGTYVRGALRSVILVAAVVVVLVGALPVLSRFVAEDPIADDRWQTARRSWTVAEMYLPFGSGIGSFETVYTPLQPVDENAAYRINKAHNDYLQALLEGGVLWAAAIAATLVAFVQRWRALARERVEVTPFDAIRTGAGIGIGLLLLHSLVDYNLQIPANAMVFALLWGLFLHEDHR